jgi:hypothetical protein
MFSLCGHRVGKMATTKNVFFSNQFPGKISFFLPLVLELSARVEQQQPDGLSQLK